MDDLKKRIEELERRMQDYSVQIRLLKLKMESEKREEYPSSGCDGDHGIINFCEVCKS